MDFSLVGKALKKGGFIVSVFATGKDAVNHLAQSVTGETIGFGGSITLTDIGLKEALSARNTILWHWDEPANRSRYPEFTAYVTSVNALAETGELINIDGAGNRISASLFGPKKIYFVVGRNKIAPDLTAAIARARNVASPLNAKRLAKATPCVKDLRCHDCASPDRICGVMAIHMRPMHGVPTEVVLVDEDLGY